MRTEIKWILLIKNSSNHCIDFDMKAHSTRTFRSDNWFNGFNALILLKQTESKAAEQMQCSKKPMK